MGTTQLKWGSVVTMYMYGLLIRVLDVHVVTMVYGYGNVQEHIASEGTKKNNGITARRCENMREGTGMF